MNQIENTVKTVISGIGLVSSGGIGLEENFRNFTAKKSGITTVTRFPMAPKVKTNIAGLIPNIPTSSLPQNVIERLCEDDLKQEYVKAAFLAAVEGIKDADVAAKITENPRRTGLFVASSLGNFLFVSELVKDYFLDNLYKITSLIHGMNSYLPARLASIFNIKGPCCFVSSSCTSSLNAIMQADRLIKCGMIDRAVIVGVDICLEMGTYHLWNKIRVLSHRNDDPTTACRPYCNTRDGMVVGEAAGCFILEKESDCKSEYYAKIRGIGLSNGSSDFIRPTLEDITLAISDCMKDADSKPQDIDFIAGSASGSQVCDHFETEAVAALFGTETERIPMFAFKSFIGTSFGVQAISEGALALQSFRTNKVPEVRNIFEHDPRVKSNVYYDHTKYSEYKMRKMLFINHGFAGNHMAVVYER
ncbi:MAG: hypothetical protein HQM10_21915 [Candidatus Riflebacteria bacterium]|nr:hypothetical protein [Candidatus Riflebacteria bacterium]